MNITNRLTLAALLFLFPVIGALAGEDWIYAVKPGDTLTDVADAYLPKPGDWRKLQQLNRVTEPKHLNPGSNLRIPVAWLRKSPAVADVIRIQGEVRKIVKDAVLPISPGDKLAPGDAVSTGVASNLTLRFVDGSRLLVSQNSRLTLTRMMLYGKTGMAHTSVNLREGSVATQVAQQKGAAAKYEIASQALNLGVRGTDFRVGVEADGVTRSEVLKGRVMATGSGVAVSLAGGYGTYAAPGKPPAAPIELPPAPDLSGLPAILERVPLRFNWPAQPGIAKYRAEVFADRSCETLLLEGVFQGASAKWLDLPDGKYTLRVRGVDANGLEGLNADREFTLKVRPEPPLVAEPLDGMMAHGDETRFSWARPAAAHDFRLQLAATSDFAALLFDVPHIAADEYRLALAPGQYYWRIASVAADGDQGPFSDAQGFVQRKVPESPSATSQQMDDKHLSFRWKAGEAGQKFRVQLARDGDFRTMVSDTLVDEAQFSMARPEAGTYFLRIKTLDSDGFEGPFSQAQRIEVPGTFPTWVLLMLVPALFAL